MTVALLQKPKIAVKTYQRGSLTACNLMIEKSERPDAVEFSTTPSVIKIGKSKLGCSNKVLIS